MEFQWENIYSTTNTCDTVPKILLDLEFFGINLGEIYLIISQRNSESIWC